HRCCSVLRSFAWCGSAADLRCFPTRRSSDLPLSAAVWLRPVPILKAIRYSSRRHSRRQTETSRRFLCRNANKAEIDRAAFRWDQDRKSTRLNSSHVKISYAVFCLKKKKIHPKPSRPPISTSHWLTTAAQITNATVRRT